MLKKTAKWLLIITILGAVLGFGGLAGIFYYYGRDLPELLDRDDFNPPQMTRILSAEGEVIGEYFTPGAKRTVVPLEDIPPHVRHAFMAAEDADFMTHEGIDWLGMVRAFYYAVRYDAGIKGTSTITQQVIKNLVLTPERSIERKIKEIILARQIEQNLTKEDILYLYLNQIYLGHGVNGVEEAARHYFGKSASELTLPEAATLAGLTQSPERHTPFRHPDRAKKRREFVLKQLWEKGFVEEAAYRKAVEVTPELADPDKAEPYLWIAPYFTEHVRKRLIDRYGEEKVVGGGLRVRTTLRVKDQVAAQEAVRKGIAAYDDRKKYYRPKRKLAEDDISDFIEKQTAGVAKRGIKRNALYDAVVTSVDAGSETVNLKIGKHDAVLLLQPKARIFGGKKECTEEDLSETLVRGHVLRVQVLETDGKGGAIKAQFAPGPEVALVSIDPKTRHVVALVGGYDFDFNEYDHATQAHRQTGSTFKPFVYGAALEKKIITPASIFIDSPAVFPLHGGKTWSPKNSDGQWRGPVRIREGLGASRNVIAVRVLKELGLDPAKEFARRMGIKSELTDNYTMVMGSSELTPLEITNAYATFASGGLAGEPAMITRVESVRGEREDFRPETERVLDPAVAHLISDLMTSVVHGYTDSKGRRRGGTAHSLAKLGHRVAGKTGTTNEARDAWFIGFTPGLVTGVWVGFDEPKSLGRKEYGGRVAGPIWLTYMKKALEGQKPREFEVPEEGITTAVIDPATGKLARGDEGIEEKFLTGTAPTEYAPVEGEDPDDSFLLGQFGD
jgi:penicillin-binding protein 1A